MSYSTHAQKKKKHTGSDFKTEMVQHYTKFYKQMIKNQDFVSAIVGLNHLVILKPENSALRDTLGLLYYTKDRPNLAIKTIGSSNSKLALKTKALAYKKLENFKETINNYEALLKDHYDVLDAYELAQLQYGMQNFGDAKSTINKALNAAKDEKVKIIVANNSYIETKVTAAFLNILGLIEYNNNVANIDKATAIFDQAIAIDPEFILAVENKKSLLTKKMNPEKKE